MAKKSQAPALTPKTALEVVFPELSAKAELECQTVLQDQIILIDVCVETFVDDRSAGAILSIP